MSASVHGDAPPPVVSEPIPRGQQFFDNIFLLLILGLLIMIVLYTAWGMWEILTLPQATLP
jgi:hypothetical protein